MVLVDTDRNVRPLFDSCLYQVTQEWSTRIGTRTGRCLADNRAVSFIGSFHDGMHLFHVVNVIGRDTVAVFGSVVQQLA
jgi:hypothetical protein